MNILALDCASVSAGVALLSEGKVLGESFVNVALTHSQTLLPMAEELLQNTKSSMQETDAFAVTVGPGSFTGVRIGVAAVKGMADALGKPCFPISALEAAAFPFRQFPGLVCPLMDARRDQVYTALFRGKERLLEDSAMSVQELQAILEAYPKESVLLVGDGMQKGMQAFASSGLSVQAARPQLQYIHASSVGYLAQEHMQNGEKPIEASRLVPVYLRLPQAQRELNHKKNNI